MSLMDKQGFGATDSNSSPIAINRVPSNNEQNSFQNNEKSYYARADVEATSSPPSDDASDVVLRSEREIATHVISVDDDPSLNPWTFRAWFLGLGLSAFSGSLGMFISFLALPSASHIEQPKSTTSNR